MNRRGDAHALRGRGGTVSFRSSWNSPISGLPRPEAGAQRTPAMGRKGGRHVS